MWSKIKKIFIVLSVLTAITIIAVIIYSKDRTYYNEDTMVGNSIGNIYNGGLFCEQDGRIYFSNDNDDGCLYVMTSDGFSPKKLHHDKTTYINVDENYIYYVRANNTRENNKGMLTFNNTGIYRINYNGKEMLTISQNPGTLLTLQGNYLYYQHYDVNNGLSLYRKKIDGTAERQITSDAAIPIGVYDNNFYFTGFIQDHNINKLDIQSNNTKTFIEGNYSYPIIRGEYIYYLDLKDNYSIYRMGLDGSNHTKLVDERCSTYNITNSGRHIYFQVDDLDNSRIARINLNTMEIETILQGNFKQIHVTDIFVFFKDYDNIDTYMQIADGKINLSTFNPPALTE